MYEAAGACEDVASDFAGAVRIGLAQLQKINPARYFYEGEGGRVIAERPGAIAGKPVREVAFGWADITPATSTRVR